jgi:hypothetical protein
MWLCRFYSCQLVVTAMKISTRGRIPDTVVIPPAYNLARHEAVHVERSRQGRSMSSVVGDEEKSWKAFWAIQALGKMHITLWRFTHNCLPSGQQFQRRQVPSSTACIHCSVEESVEHALLFCPFTRAV